MFGTSIPATNKSATSSTIIKTEPPGATGVSPAGAYPVTGFGQWGLQDLRFVNPTTREETVLTTDYREAITDIIYEKNMSGVTTLTLQANDPNRTLLKNLVAQGTEITLNDGGQKIRFSLSQYTKASDQVQMAFESSTVYRLRNQRNSTGTVTTTVSTGVTEFVASLVYALNYNNSPYETVGFVGPDYATIWSELTGNAGKAIVKVGLGRGTTTDPFEDSWTCMSRIASSVGWRLWENNNTVYFGPDEYWLGILNKNPQGLSVPPINSIMGTLSPIPVMQEFGTDIMLIDFDWDVQKPYAQGTVTCMLENWKYDIGEIVQTVGLGPANGDWIVYSIQRDLFSPQATMTLQVPMPFASVYDPNSLPLQPFPLITKLA